MKKTLAVLAILAIAGLAAYRFRDLLSFRVDRILPERSDAIPGVVLQESPAAAETVAEGLEIPWEIAFLPDGSLLVTERPGRLTRLGETRESVQVEGVHHAGEGGLLGLALHPSFETNRWLYLYMTTREGGRVTNRVDRYRYENGTLSERTTIIQNIPGAANHNGGRIAFGPDGKLYVATGDAGEAFSAQDRASLAGKILRLNDDGTLPSDNPFGNAVWSYGHRNPQGLAWDAQGRFWSTEHGRSGVRSGLDEVNLVEKGKNYGWPVIEGDDANAEMEAPFRHSGAVETWAPAGAAFVGNTLVFGGLRGETLYQLVMHVRERRSAVLAHFAGEYGRIRAVVIGPDGSLYFATSNRDGRGRARAGDDRIVRVQAGALRLPEEIAARFR